MAPAMNDTGHCLLLQACCRTVALHEYCCRSIAELLQAYCRVTVIRLQCCCKRFTALLHNGCNITAKHFAVPLQKCCSSFAVRIHLLQNVLLHQYMYQRKRLFSLGLQYQRVILLQIMNNSHVHHIGIHLSRFYAFMSQQLLYGRNIHPIIY